VLSTLNPDAARTFGGAMPVDPVRDSIARALRARGHRVDEHVGGASFRCDLAIAGPEDGSYRIGVLLDRDADRALGVEERFLFRPSILRAFGWRILDVPVAAWFRAQSAVIERIEAELNRDSWGLADADPFTGVVLSPELDAGPAPTPPPPIGSFADAGDDADQAEPVMEAASGLTEFRLVQGTSNKYWRVGVSDCDLIVEFGRVGTKGQRVIKTFNSPERARSEANKLTLEKTRKGYEEVS
jgi:predicted DNA-binding WGR domain protein